MKIMHSVITCGWLFAGAFLFFTEAAPCDDEIVTEPEKCLLLGVPSSFAYLDAANQVLLENGSGIHSMDADSGKHTWNRYLGAYQNGRDVRFGRNRVLGWSGSGVFLLDIATGEELWSLNSAQCGQVETACLSPDENQVLTLGSQGCFLYTPASDSCVSLPRPEGAWLCGWFSGNEKLLFLKRETVAEKTTRKCIIVDTSSGQTETAWERDADRDNISLRFSPQGEFLEVNGAKGKDTTGFRILDAATGALVRTLADLPGEMKELSWLRDPERLCYMSLDKKQVFLADLESGAILCSLALEGHTFFYRPYEDAAGNYWLVSGDEANNWYVWPLTAAGKPRKILGGARISAGHLSLMTMDRNYIFTQFKQESNVWRYALYGYDGPQKIAAWQCDGAGCRWANQLLGNDLKHLVQCYDTRENDRDLLLSVAFAVYAKDQPDALRKSDGHPLAMSPDGRYLAVQTENLAACLLDLKTGKECRRIEITVPPEWKGYCAFMEAAFSADGKRVAFNTTRSLEIVEVAEGFQKWPMIVENDQSYTSSTPSFSPNGKQLLCGGYHFAWLYNADSGDCLHSFEETERFIQPHSNGEGFWKNLARNAKDWMGTLTDRFKQSTYVEARFSSDGTKVITYSAGQVIRVWDAESGEMLHTIHTGLPEKRNASGEIINTIVFSPTRAYAFCFNSDGFGIASLWSVEDGALRRQYQLPAPENPCRQAAVEDDGSAVYLVQNHNLYQWPGVTK